MSDLRRFVASFAKFFLLVSAVVVAIALMPVANDYFVAFADKLERLRDTPGKRIIVVGGSGLAFGLDSGALEEDLGRPVLNMGLHAGMGIEFMLRHVLPHVRRGDVVVVIPEYGTLDETAAPDEGLISAVLLAAPIRTRNELQGADVAPLLRGFSNVALHRLLVDPAVELQRLLGARHDYRYARDRFDAHGDEVGHLHSPSLERKWSMHIEPRIEARVDALNRFDASVRARGARAVFLYPSLPQSVESANSATLSIVKRVIDERLSMPHFGTPSEAVQPDNAFFDSPNHPNATGRAAATKRIIASLREARESL